jgi:ABC-type ATPase with predicted acetyltransferase domain
MLAVYNKLKRRSILKHCMGPRIIELVKCDPPVTLTHRKTDFMLYRRLNIVGLCKKTLGKTDRQHFFKPVPS